MNLNSARTTYNHIALLDENGVAWPLKLNPCQRCSLRVAKNFWAVKAELKLGKRSREMKALSSDKIYPPFGRYSSGIEIPAGWRVVKSSGQLGIAADGTIPEDVYSQARICFDNIAQVLAQASMSAANVAHISAYVTDRDYFPHYMRARDEFIGDGDPLPASTLLIVSGFTRPEFKVA